MQGASCLCILMSKQGIQQHSLHSGLYQYNAQHSSLRQLQSVCMLHHPCCIRQHDAFKGRPPGSAQQPCAVAGLQREAPLAFAQVAKLGRAGAGLPVMLLCGST